MEQYRRLVDASPAGILVVSNNQIDYANPAAADLLGLSGDAVPSAPAFIESFDPASQAALREHLQCWAGGRAGGPVDVTRVGPDGRLRHLAIDGAPLAGAADGAVQLVLRDVTARVQRERAIRDSEERLALALAGAQEGVWDWNLETNAVVYSARWKQMLGYSDEEIENHISAWERLVHPDDRSRADRANDSVARGERATYQAEFRLRHKNGHYIHVLSRGYPVRRDAGGRVIRIVGTHLDLTEQKRAEAALLENEERLKLAFEGAQEGVWDWNLATGTVVYSSRWKQMLGYADDEIEPHVSAWERLLHPDDMAQAQRVSESVRQGAATYEGEFRLQHKDGHYVHVLSRGYPVRLEPGGPVVRIVGTHFDLTARKQAEAERSRTEFLTRLVFAQEDERLRIAREMHDQFGEQLTALAQRIRLLKGVTGQNEELRGHVDSLEAIAQQLDRDVDHLVWELRPTALDDLGLRAALSNYVRNWSTRQGVAVTLHMSGLVDHRLPPHTETALYRIAQEALTNVAKHAQATSVDVILERRGQHVLMIIEDDGIGFEGGTGEEQPQGAGLVGMKERAALVGAALEIESSPGGGTTVFVRIDAGSDPGGGEHA
jgi:PAS domain S-box-containing protein